MGLREDAVRNNANRPLSVRSVMLSSVLHSP
jgi:hypothetical protein